MSIQHFLGQPLRLPPSKVPRRMVLERLSWRVTCLDHKCIILSLMATRSLFNSILRAMWSCQTFKRMRCETSESRHLTVFCIASPAACHLDLRDSVEKVRYTISRAFETKSLILSIEPLRLYLRRLKNEGRLLYQTAVSRSMAAPIRLCNQCRKWLLKSTAWTQGLRASHLDPWKNKDYGSEVEINVGDG